MMPLLKQLIVVAAATSWLLPATVIAGQAGVKRHPKAAAQSKKAPKRRWTGYGFLPGYRQPPNLTDWRARSARYRVSRQPYELRYWSYDGQLQYGWGYPGVYRGRWNGGSFGPCWTSTPIGMMWTCGR
jgi:hypothetical protein